MLSPSGGGLSDGSRALPVTAWRDLASVIGIRKAGPGAASCLDAGVSLLRFLWESRYEACVCKHLSAIRSVRSRSFGGRITQFDSDHSVEDETSPSFFSLGKKCLMLPPRLRILMKSRYALSPYRLERTFASRLAYPNSDRIHTSLLRNATKLGAAFIFTLPPSSTVEVLVDDLINSGSLFGLPHSC